MFKETSVTVELKRSVFGTTADGSVVELFTFTHTDGLAERLVLSVINFGCIIQSLSVPDRDGALADVVLGYNTLAEYEADKKYLGCVVGRYANRIAGGKFTLEGVEYQLETNSHGNHIHGGGDGFHKQVWHASVEEHDGLPQLVLQHSSAHMHGGYPGNIDCRVTYTVNSRSELEVGYHATTDRPTVINLTNHSYFNLSGQHCATENGVLDHRAYLNCDFFLPTDERGIPLSAPVSVDATPMDFRTETSFASRIDDDFTQLKNGNGYDHNWVVNRGSCNGPDDGPGKLNLAARITDPVSGRLLTVATTQPGIQCYTSNHFDDLSGKGGMVYQFRGALCLETQHFPDSPNHHEFPSVVLTPEKPFYEQTVFRPGVLSAV